MRKLPTSSRRDILLPAVLVGMLALLVLVFFISRGEKKEIPPVSEDTSGFEERYIIQLTDPTLKDIFDRMRNIFSAKVSSYKRCNTKSEFGSEYFYTKLDIPSAFPLPLVNQKLVELITDANYELIDAKETPSGNSLVLDIGYSGKIFHRIYVRRLSSIPLDTVEVAILIDDFGVGELDVEKQFLALPIDITPTVIPHSEHWEESFSLIRGREFLVHMPMEPEPPAKYEGEFIITADMKPDEVAGMVDSAFALMPAAVGMNNHMGSLATQKKSVMVPLLETVHTSGRFFVDSRTTIYSVAQEVADSLGFPILRLYHYIDYPESTSLATETRLIKLILDIREKGGDKIITGHTRQETLSALKNVLPLFKKWGVRVVPASKIYRKLRKWNAS